MRRPIRTTLTVAACTLLGTAAVAQPLTADRTTEQPVAEEGTTSPVPSLQTWDPATIQTATLITDLDGEDVIAPDGKVLGTIDDVLITNGEMTLFGFLLDSGIVVPFGDVSMSVVDNTTVITAPGHAYSSVEEIEFGDAWPDREGVQPLVFRAEEVMDRHMLLNDAVRYGDVTNLAFDETGRLVAVQAQYAGPTVTRYALPIPVGTIVDADADGFYLPYDFEEVKQEAPTAVGSTD